ncbi:polymeric immunoglobulin receptor-like [Menidia menidia]
MNTQQLVLLCFIPAALGSQVFTKLEGDSISFGCAFDPPPGSRFFTKGAPEGEVLLVGAGNASAQRGRFILGLDGGIFYVGITQLRTSDSGLYSCGVGDPASPDLQRQFELRVTASESQASSPEISEQSDQPKSSCAAPPPPEVLVCSEAEGGAIRVTCSFPSADLFSLFFCRGQCRKEDVLVEAGGPSAQKGRFGIQYESRGVFHVTVSNLTASDADLYRCGVDITSAPNPCSAVEIRVTEETPELNTLEFVVADKAAKSCVLSSAFEPTEQNPEEDPSKGLSDRLMVVCIAVLGVLLAVLLAALLLKSRMGNAGPSGAQCCRGDANSTERARSNDMECSVI